MNLKWPSKATNDYEPWYVIGWRLLFFPAFMAGRLTSSLAVAAMYGPKDFVREFDRPRE